MGITSDYQPALFNSTEFVSLQDANPVSYYILEPARKKALAGIHFHVEDQWAQSPFKSPFGSLEYSGKIYPDLLFRFLEYFEQQLREKGVSEIFIKNPPRIYEPEKSSMLETFFLNQDYRVSDAEVSAVIPVENRPFTDGIRHSEKLRLRQAEQAGFTFQNLADDRVDEVYNFISECHREKGYNISITREALQRTIKEFPDHYFLFALFQTEKMVAASVAIRVRDNILYNFLMNHDKKYNRLSPPVFLMKHVFEHCRQNKISFFDLGTSALQGKPNFKLLDFKRHIGGKPSAKLTFYKKIG